jgi:BirA family transcriptional regulator, biotin operon repressor / biotin---[acetyl-CoA-carboxylase] ligase
LTSEQRAISFHLSDIAKAAGFQLVVFDTVGSTNDSAFELAQSGANRTWVVARGQTAGRGRHGRQWQSPPGNLYASLLLVDLIPQSKLPQVSFVAGVALAQAVRQIVPHPSRMRLKWPNDLFLDDGKLAGILIESRSLAGGAHGVVIGFGVNCQTHPEHLPYKTADLGEAGADETSAEAVLSVLSAQMVTWLHAFAQGFDAVRDTWLSLAAGLGEPITVRTAARSFDGIFETIDATGRLVLRDQTGTHTIEAGDVLLGHRVERMNERDDK